MSMKVGSRSATSDSSFVWGQGNDAGVLFMNAFEHVERLETDLSGRMAEV